MSLSVDITHRIFRVLHRTFKRRGLSTPASMVKPRATLVCVLAVAVGAIAEERHEPHRFERALQLLSSMPSCGSSCLTQGIQNSTCALNDLDCSCSNTGVEDHVTLCVLKHCSIKQALTTKNISATICEEPIRSRQYTLRYGIAGFALVVAAYILRILPKTFDCAFNKRIVTQLWWDDIAITVSMLTAIPGIVLAVLITEAGLGRDIWTVEFHNITRMLKLNFFGTLTYVVGLGLVKVSLLLTYLRFFPAPVFARWTQAIIAINLGFIFAVVMVITFGCSPPSYYWHRWDLEHHGRCIDINTVAWSVAAINIFLDIIVLITPMPQLWGLQLNMRKKCLLMFMFGIGGFASIVSILRLHGIVKYADSRNLTWDNVPTSYWSRMEFHAAFICACLPAIYTDIRRFFTHVVTNSRDGSGQRRTKTRSNLKTDNPMSAWMVSIDRHVREKAWKFNSMPRTRLHTVGESDEELHETPRRTEAANVQTNDTEATYVEHIEMGKQNRCKEWI